jgi:two-component system, OmpR family, response regulator ArlR
MKDYRILIIEDEKQMAQLLEMELVHEGYIVDTAYDGIAGLDILGNADYDLVLLDVMLPGLNGIEVCRRLRQFSDVPVIMLTAKGDVHDKVTGLDAGANDYLPKPFAIEELLARVRVYTRDVVPKNSKNRLVLNDIIMDNEKHQVWRSGKEIELTKKEYDLLEMLLINKNVVLSRDQLIEGVWGYDYEGEANVVDVFIRYLRSKLDDGFEKKVITTVRGVGYVIKGD